MKSAGLSACFKEEGVITKKMCMPTSPEFLWLRSSETFKIPSPLISRILIGNRLNSFAPLRLGDKIHVKNTAPLTCLFICTPKMSFYFNKTLGSVSHTITTNFQLHHHCTSAFQSESWC